MLVVTPKKYPLKDIAKKLHELGKIPQAILLELLQDGQFRKPTKQEAFVGEMHAWWVKEEKRLDRAPDKGHLRKKIKLIYKVLRHK